MVRWVICVVGWLAAASAQQGIPADEFQVTGSAYVPPSHTTLRVETRLVEVGVVVRDSHGRPVGGLTKDDFEVEDQGKGREITAFTAEHGTPPIAKGGQPSPVTPAGAATGARPRFLALVFDDFNMAAGELMPVRIAAKRFVAEGLGEGGRAAVFFTSRGQVVPFTSDPAKLEEAIDRLAVRNRDAGLSFCPYLSTYEAFLITEQHDASVLSVKVQEAGRCGVCRPRDPACASVVEGIARQVWGQTQDTSRRSLLFLAEVVKGLEKLPGQRVLVLSSAGFISRTLEREREAVVDHALRANVVVHALDAKGLFTQDMGTSGPSMGMASLMLRQSLGTRPQMENNDSLAVLAESTGGRFFHNNNDLTLGFKELGLAPEASYTLGFSPEGAADNRYHRLKVRLKTKGHYSVQARQGYFSQPESPEPARVERAIDREMLLQETPEDVPVRLLMATQATKANGQLAVHALLHLDTPHLPFTVTGRLRTLQLEIVAALFDERSGFVSGQEVRATYMLPEETFQRLADGQNVGLTLSAGPGRYRLRIAIREENGGKMTAVNRGVEIREREE
jgi:VWFA-related protein